MTNENESTTVVQEPKWEEVTIPAIEGKINVGDDRINMYTVEVPAETVGHFYVEPAISIKGGFQRQLDQNRAARIGRLMAGDRMRNVDPEPNVHGGLLAYADEDEITFKSGKLTIHHPLKLIDGQHRAGGANWATKYGKDVNWTETVRIVTGATREELAMWYLRCNLEARKVAPANIILNVAGMNGVVLGRKSWIARMVVVLASQEPFFVDGFKLVSFSARDGARIAAQTLYRAIDIMLPDELNQEGKNAEKKAIQYAHRAFSIYANIVEEWGSTDERDRLANLAAYSFTSIVAFAHLYGAIEKEGRADEDIENALREAFPTKEMPDVGSGEKAAVALASYAAAKMDIPLSQVA